MQRIGTSNHTPWGGPMQIRTTVPTNGGSRRRRSPWRRVALLLLLALLWPGAVAAERVVTLRSATLVVYDNALDAFKHRYQAQLGPSAAKTVAPIQYIDLVLDDLGPTTPAAVRAARPDLLVTVGQGALESVAGLTGIPVVHLLAVTVPEALSKRSDVVGIALIVAPDPWVEAFVRTTPGRTRVGVVYDPRRTGAWVERAVAFGGLQGLSVTAVAVSHARGVGEALEFLRGRVDALWMIPDLTAVTPASVAVLARFSLEEGVPLFTFAEKYLSAGATAAFVVDPAAAGSQSASLAAGLTGRAGVDAQPSVAARVVTRVNPTLARRFRVDAGSE